MLKKLLIYLFLFLSSTSLYANYQVHYIKDKSHFKDISEVIGKEFDEIPNKKPLGRTKYAWLKVTITNDSKEDKENYLSINNLQVFKKVYFYTVVNNQVIKKDTNFEKYKNHNVPNRIGNALLYDNIIKAGSKIDVYIYITAGSNIYFDIKSGEQSEIISKISKSTIILLILVGALLSLGVYYLFLYIFTPTDSYLYYTIFVFSLALWGFYIYGGYVYYFDIFRAAPFSNIFVLVLPASAILFFRSIYKDDIRFKNYKYILNVFLAVYAFAIASYILGRLGFVHYFSISKYAAVLYQISFFTVLVISILIYFKKLPYSGLFIIGFAANFIGVSIAFLFFAGLSPYNEFTLYANMMGGTTEAILFSILLTYKMRQVYKEKDEAQNLNKIQNFKMGIMSETIDFISHQWRQPLAQINSSIMAIDDIAYNKKYQNKELENELLSIEKTTNYMSTTIDDFRNLFSSKKKSEKIDLNKAINNVSEIVKKSLSTKDIKLELELEDKLYFQGNQGELSQVLLILLNNAKDALLENSIKNSLIKIKLFSKDKYILIELCDNAGGYY